MKTLPILIAAAALCLAACSNTPRHCAVEIDTSIPAETLGDSISRTLSCAQAATSIVEWMSGDEEISMPYARKLTQTIAYAYGDSLPRFLHAIDSVGEQLPPKRRARMLIRSCEPEYLGHLVALDPNDSKLVPIIESQLASQPTALALFRRGYQAEKSK